MTGPRPGDTTWKAIALAAEARVAELETELASIDRADKGALHARALRAEARLVDGDPVWRSRYENLASVYQRQGRSLTLHQHRADLMEGRAVRAERALRRFGRRHDVDLEREIERLTEPADPAPPGLPVSLAIGEATYHYLGTVPSRDSWHVAALLQGAAAEMLGVSAAALKAATAPAATGVPQRRTDPAEVLQRLAPVEPEPDR